ALSSGVPVPSDVPDDEGAAPAAEASASGAPDGAKAEPTAEGADASATSAGTPPAAPKEISAEHAGAAAPADLTAQSLAVAPEDGDAASHDGAVSDTGTEAPARGEEPTVRQLGIGAADAADADSTAADAAAFAAGLDRASGADTQAEGDADAGRVSSE